MPDTDILLIGGGMAAANCARWLREEGFDGSVTLCGRELDPPYNRPPCSKGHLQGKESREDVLFRPDAWWGEQRIDLRTRTSVTALDPAAKAVTLSSGEQLSFDKALIATGAVVRGAGVLPDVHLASAAGLPIGERGGVRCDATLAVDGFADLWAAGDMCEFDSVIHGRPMRIEHWDVAFNQGKTAALNMLGRA